MFTMTILFRCGLASRFTNGCFGNMRTQWHWGQTLTKTVFTFWFHCDYLSNVFSMKPPVPSRLLSQCNLRSNYTNVTFSDFKPIFSWLSPKCLSMSSRFRYLISYLLSYLINTFLYLKDHRTRQEKETRSFIYLMIRDVPWIVICQSLLIYRNFITPQVPPPQHI